MAQINLLKQTGSSGGMSGFSPKILVQILAGVFVVVLGYYGFLFFDSKNVDKKMDETIIQIESAQQQASQVKDRNELFTRQQQVKNLKDLLGTHLYWSQIFSPLAKVTLKNASYSSLKFTPPHTLTMTVKVLKLEDLDKFTQVFNLEEFNKNFSNVRINGYNKVLDNATSSVIQFNVEMDYNPAMLNYNDPSIK